MSLEQQVENALAEAGKQLRDDLWSPNDHVVLAQRAKDLVGLELKARSTPDPKKKEQYKLAAKLVVQHVQLLALTRMSTAEKHLQEAVGKLFLNVLQPLLVKLLPSLF